MTKLLHPDAKYSVKSVDVFHGGTERDTLEESAKLAYDCVRYLPKDEEVLYINTLVDQPSLDKVMKKYQSRVPRLLYTTWLDKHFMNRLEFIQKMLEEGKVTVLVINSFDCAALTQRHRVLLMQWVRSMRNMYQLRIIIFMQNLPGYYGVNGSLRFMAANVVEVGAYKQRQQAEIAREEIESEAEIAKEFEELNRIVVVEEDATEPETSVAPDEIPNETSIVPSGEVTLEEGVVRAEPAPLLLESRVVEEEEPTWVSELDDEELNRLLKMFGDDRESQGAVMLVEEIARRASAPASVQYLPLKNKELSAVDVA